MEKQNFIFFWSHNEERHGEVAVFSNWFPASFVDDGGVRYSSVEQYMMKMKAELFSDTDIGEQIMKTNDPKKVKSLGRKVKNFDVSVWEQHALDIVAKGCYYKFKQNEKLKRILLGTQDKTLVEASPYDKIWGIGLSADNPLAWSRDTWLGTNWLGEALCRAREQIRSEEEAVKTQ